MKRIVFLLTLWVCLVIDDKLIHAYFKNVEVTTVSSTDYIKSALEKILNVKVKLKFKASDAYISKCSIYEAENGTRYFVKMNSKPKFESLFHGEFESLKALQKTKSVIVPTPLFAGKADNGQFFILLSYLNIAKLKDVNSAELGNQLADLHLFNLHRNCSKHQHVKKFGFHCQTNCGVIPQNNTWTDDWITFFIENRMGYQINLLQSKPENSTEKHLVLTDYWPRLKKKIPKFFEGIDVRPSLLHGDLWFGNTAESNSKPVIFDPASFYGHHEYDIATTFMFNNLFGGNYSIHFYNAYYKKIPKDKGSEKRKRLYQLFHYFNHWNHYGKSYASHTMDLFERILKLK